MATIVITFNEFEAEAFESVVKRQKVVKDYQAALASASSIEPDWADMGYTSKEDAGVFGQSESESTQGLLNHAIEDFDMAVKHLGATMVRDY